MPFLRVLEPSVGPTGGYSADRKPIAELWRTLSNGAETESWESFTRSGSMPWIGEAAFEEIYWSRNQVPEVKTSWYPRSVKLAGGVAFAVRSPWREKM